MRKNMLPPILAIVGGAVGFGLRKWQLSAGFEPDTGLAIPGAPSALCLAALSAVLALSVIVLCWGKKDSLPWDQAFASGRQNSLFITAILLSAALLLVSAGAEVLSLTGHFPHPQPLAVYADSPVARAASMLLPPLRAGLCLAGLPCIFLWGREDYRCGDRGKENLCLLVLCLLLCVWLISDYQLRAADPVIQDYVYEVFAIVSSLLGLYYISGYSFQTGKPRRTLFFCLMGAYFSLVTLADSHTFADLFRYGFSVLFLTAHAALILSDPPGGKRLENPNTEANDHG